MGIRYKTGKTYKTVELWQPRISQPSVFKPITPLHRRQALKKSVQKNLIHRKNQRLKNITLENQIYLESRGLRLRH